MEMDSAIIVDRVMRSYGSIRAVDRLSLRVPGGQIVGLLGPNGAGKTTLIRMIMGIVRPEAGSIRVGSSDASEGDALGYLPEERGLYPGMSVLDHLVFLGEIKGLSRRRATDAVRHWLKRLDIEALGGKQVRQLSRGQKQKVQLASALLHEPRFLILDEPFSGLDPVVSEEILELLRDLAREGVGILLSTHLMDQAGRVCDRVFLMNEGKVAFDGTAAEACAHFGVGDLNEAFLAVAGKGGTDR